MSRISKDALRVIFSYLDVRAKTIASEVCQLWHTTIHDMLGVGWIDARIIEHKEAINELMKLKSEKMSVYYNYDSYTRAKLMPFIKEVNRRIKNGLYGKGVKKPRKLNPDDILYGISDFRITRYEQTLDYPANIVVRFHFSYPNDIASGRYTMIRYETEGGPYWKGWSGISIVSFIKPFKLLYEVTPGVVQHVLEVIIHEVFDTVAPQLYPECFPDEYYMLPPQSPKKHKRFRNVIFH